MVPFAMSDRSAYAGEVSAWRLRLNAAERRCHLEGDPLKELLEALADGIEQVASVDTETIARAAAEGAWRASARMAAVQSRRLSWEAGAALLAVASLAFWLGYLTGTGHL